MKYTPGADGYFAGQTGYGYRSIEAFVNAVNSIRAGTATPADYEGKLATMNTTQVMTAILEAGRRSLDNKGQAYQIRYDEDGQPVSLDARDKTQDSNE
jgi:D-galacturonate reductase